ncbi:MAG: hypothetical protein ACJ79K_09155, partial [Gemmatimonadaceae bacterium]
AVEIRLRLRNRISTALTPRNRPLAINFPQVVPIFAGMSDERTTLARDGREERPARDGAGHPRSTTNRIAVIGARLREGAYGADVALEATAREIIARRELLHDPRHDLPRDPRRDR